MNGFIPFAAKTVADFDSIARFQGSQSLFGLTMGRQHYRVGKEYRITAADGCYFAILDGILAAKAVRSGSTVVIAVLDNQFIFAPLAVHAVNGNFCAIGQFCIALISHLINQYFIVRQDT